MPNLNSQLKQVDDLKKRVLTDLEVLLGIYGKMAEEVNDKFRSEYQNNNGLSGIEEFLVLNNIVKKNMMTLKNVYALLKRMRSTAGFDVEELIDKELADILK